MSDVEPDLSAQLVDALGNNEPVEPVEESVVEELPPLTDFGQRYLSTVDEAEREIAERHVRRWDAGYAKQAERWKQYESFGPPEDIKTYQALYNTFINNPTAIAEYLAGQGVVWKDPNTPAATPVAGEPVDPNLEKLSKLEEAVSYLVQTRQQETQAQAEERQLAEFNTALDQTLPKDFTPSHRDAVIRLIAGGAPSIEAAVEQLQGLMQNTINQNARQQAPTLLGSSGAPPTTKKKEVTELSDSDASKYLASLLQQGSQ